jgi:hypothetical protein
MSHPIYRVQSFAIIGSYAINVKFDDGSEQKIDFWPVLIGEIYWPLRDLAVFNKVTIDREVNTLVWPNGADFDPLTLHDWPHYAQALAERARGWEQHAI